MRVLADTSVWVQHFRYGSPRLAKQLTEGLVLMHPWIAGELACGNLKDRQATLADLRALPSLTLAESDDVLRLLEDRKLWARGLGWVDLHLLASALLSTCSVWTLDKQLNQAASELGLPAAI